MTPYSGGRPSTSETSQERKKLKMKADLSGKPWKESCRTAELTTTVKTVPGERWGP